MEADIIDIPIVSLYITHVVSFTAAHEGRKGNRLSIIIYLSIIISFFVVGAYATTDVSRLLKGADTAISDPFCYCGNCHHKLKLAAQIPILSYLRNKGRCSYCRNPIPFTDILPEILLPACFLLIVCLMGVSLRGFLSCVLLFESYKLIMILKYHHRESRFLASLTISLINNLFIFSCVGLLFLIANAV